MRVSKAFAKKMGIKVSTLKPSCQIGLKKAKSKYKNQPVIVDGVKFQSKREAKRWGELRLLEKAGIISHLKRQYAFKLEAFGGALVGTYIADFIYREGGVSVVEDCKGFRTDLYKWKKRHVKAQLGIDIRET
mgnify:CR=1 FL=1